MIEQIFPKELPSILDDLAHVLCECVNAGASVGFVLPFTRRDARAYWEGRVAPLVDTGQSQLLVSRQDGHVMGTVQLIPATMPNQPHRADVAKLLVHPKCRRRGHARALMEALEQRARDAGKSLLVLDTRSGDPSQHLYQKLGYETAGEIPDYCHNPFNARLEPTTYMYKLLK